MSGVDKLFETIRNRLFTAVIGDVMDTAGLDRQFLPPELRPLTPDTVLVGKAMPVLEADCFADTIGHSGEQGPFGLMLRALDELQAGEVYICAGASLRYALWGELMSCRALTLGAAGAVVDGFHRDTRGILASGFPVFSRGAYAQDQRLRGRVIDFRCPIEFANGVRVGPGDIIVGDIDGVLAIPADAAEDIVRAALTKVEAEDDVRARIERGEATARIFDETGVM